MFRLPVGKYPDVSCNAGVVKDIQGKSNDRLKPVIFDDPPSDVTLTGPGITGED